MKKFIRYVFHARRIHLSLPMDSNLSTKLVSWPDDSTLETRTSDIEYVHLYIFTQGIHTENSSWLYKQASHTHLYQAEDNLVAFSLWINNSATLAKIKSLI